VAGAALIGRQREVAKPQRPSSPSTPKGRHSPRRQREAEPRHAGGVSGTPVDPQLAEQVARRDRQHHQPDRRVQQRQQRADQRQPARRQDERERAGAVGDPAQRDPSKQTR
jgi:hypothetical protein